MAIDILSAHTSSSVIYGTQIRHYSKTEFIGLDSVRQESRFYDLCPVLLAAFDVGYLD
jgi:hypothetical protein